MDENNNNQSVKDNQQVSNHPLKKEGTVFDVDNQNSQSIQGEIPQEAAPEDFVGEQIPSPENLSPPSDFSVQPSFSEPPMPPMYEENKIKYLIIGLSAVFFVIIFVFLVRFLSGMIGGKKSQKVSLTYWGLWEEEAIFTPLIADYQRKNPHVTIKYIKRSHQDYREKLLIQGERGRGPDIFRFHNTWVPSLKKILAKLPKEVMSDAEYEKTFYPVIQQDLKVGNYYYGLPIGIDGLILVYNNALFKSAGIEIPPKTWEELIDYAAKLTVKDQDGNIITSGIALGTANNIEHFSDIFGWMLLQNGGDLKNLVSQEAIGTLQSYRRFAEPPNNFWDENMPNSIAAFIQEKVAMIIVPSWWILVIKEQNPEIEIKTTLLPALPGETHISLANYWVEGVSTFSKNQLEAWKFLRFLVEKENLTKLYDNMAKSRLFGEPYSRVDLSSTLIQNEYTGPVIQQANNMKSLPLISRTFDNGINDQIIKYLENAINSTINGVSYEEALKTASQGINDIFQKYEIQ